MPQKSYNSKNALFMPDIDKKSKFFRSEAAIKVEPSLSITILVMAFLSPLNSIRLLHIEKSLVSLTRLKRLLSKSVYRVSVVGFSAIVDLSLEIQMIPAKTADSLIYAIE